MEITLGRRAVLAALACVECAATAPETPSTPPPPSTPSTSPASSPSAPSASPASTPSLQAALRAGGVTLYLRHPATDRGGVDDAHSPREQQRLLSPEGEQQARDLGGAFERLGATPGRVLTSPSWRCRDAATLAFGRGEVDWGLQALLQDTDTRPERERYGAAMVATVVPDGQVTVLIGHSSNIVAATGVSLPEGGGVLVRGDGERAQVLGALTPTDWAVWASEG